MENNNIDKSKLMDAIGALGKGAALKKAIAEKDYNSILSALPKGEADELKRVMNDKAARDKLLSSPQAQEIMRMLQNGKQ